MSRPERTILWLAMLSMPVSIVLTGLPSVFDYHDLIASAAPGWYPTFENAVIWFAFVSGTLWLIAGLITLFDIEARHASRLHKTIHSTLLLLTFGLSMVPWFFNHAHQPRNRQNQ